MWQCPLLSYSVNTVAPSYVILNNSSSPCNFHFRCDVFKASWTQLMSSRQGIWAQKPRAVIRYQKQQIARHPNLILETLMLNLHHRLLQKELRTGKSLSSRQSVHTTAFPKAQIAEYEGLVCLFCKIPKYFIYECFLSWTYERMMVANWHSVSKQDHFFFFCIHIHFYIFISVFVYSYKSEFYVPLPIFVTTVVAAEFWAKTIVQFEMLHTKNQ